MPDNSKGKDKAQEQLPWAPDEEMKRDRAHREASRKKMLAVSSEVLTSRPVCSAQAYLELVALHHAQYTTPSAVKADATDDEKAADRERQLAAPTTKHRKVFSEWPRDPNGDILRPEHSKLGKMLANKVQFWGATLLDFYYVRRIPDCPNLMTISTGSKLAEWMKAQGETYADDQLARAEREPYPEEVVPYPMGGLLKSLSGGFGAFQPFVKTSSLPVLQQRILLYFLPKTLIVHDPYRTLTARRSSVRPTSWNQEPDIVHTYRLQLSEAGKEKMLIETRSVELADAIMEKRVAEFLDNPTAERRPHERGFLFVPQGTKPGPCPPAVFFMHGARAPRTTAEEAHLYLTPNQLCGTGNHSVVYNAEWEVPRSLIVEDVICKKCVFEKGIEILVAQDGPNGDTKDPKWLQKTGTVEETAYENHGFSVAAFETNGNEIKDENGELVTYDIEPPSRTVSRKFNGPVRVIDTGVQWQRAADGTTCKHRAGEADQPSSPSEPPLTVRVSIVAKMSIEDDNHLEKEANIYQEFPVHFYQHFTGYNVIAPLHDPVPVGALVPQFYGHYVPDETIPPSFWKKVKKGGKWKKKGDNDAKQGKVAGEDQMMDGQGAEAEEKAEGQSGQMDKVVAASEAKGDGDGVGATEAKDASKGAEVAPKIEGEDDAMNADGEKAGEGEDEKMDTDVATEGATKKDEAADGDGPTMDLDAKSATSEKAMDVDVDNQNVTLDSKEQKESKTDDGEEDEEEEEDRTSEKADRLKYDYRSPLLLIENCGESVCDILKSMSIDDRQHCTSLYLRLHHEGWLHNSVYTRNILYQPGPVDASPLERAQNATKRSDLRKTSFRLIDFGRTEKMENGNERCLEEEKVTKTFQVLHNGMN